MTPEQARGLLTEDVIENAIGPLDTFSHQCHAASIALVKSGLIAESRVARGSCRGVGGQHSWVVVGMDCYDPKATIVDLTAWSYDVQFGGKTVPRVWVTTMEVSAHRPQGWGPPLMEWGCPEGGGAEHIDLVWKKPPDVSTSLLLGMFEDMVGPLDRRFWANLANHCTMVGWPAREFVEAMLDTEEVAALVPIDIAGMLTDRNPSGLYLAGEADRED